MKFEFKLKLANDMKRIILKIFFIILMSVISQQAFATAQFGDLLIINGDTSWIDSNPLEEYFETKNLRKIGGTEMQMRCTALWRGYVATWILENDSLFLVRIQTNYCSDSPTEIDLTEEFGSKKVFAEWFNSTITQTEGELLKYVHMGYMSIYEAEVFFTFKSGILSEKTKNSYLIRNDKLTFPGEMFLRDTIKTIILKAIPMEERQNFNEEDFFSVIISFNNNGAIEDIRLSFNENPETKMQKMILSRTKDALKSFPKLMKVKHERYTPPSVNIWFSGHCLKFPNDKDYGCD